MQYALLFFDVQLILAQMGCADVGRWDYVKSRFSFLSPTDFVVGEESVQTIG